MSTGFRESMRKKAANHPSLRRFRPAVLRFEALALGLRGVGSSMLQSSGVRNVYHASVQRAGSQWIKAIFADAVVRKASGLRPFPQFRYEWNEFRRSFPAKTFVPGLYMSYDLYREIKKAGVYKTFYVLRDPRDVVVSWCHAMKSSHPLMGQVETHRSRLANRTGGAEYSYCIDALQLRFAQQRSWLIGSREDDDVIMVKYEDLVADPVGVWAKIFHHCQIELDESELRALIERYSFGRMKSRDVEHRADASASHYRSGTANQWKDAFTEGNVRHFREVSGNLIEELGYEW